MAQEQVNAILQALAAAKQRGLQARQYQSQNELEQQRIDAEKERISNEHEHQAAILKAAQSVHQLQKVKALQEISQGIQQGTPVPGETQPAQFSLGENKFVTHELPITDETTGQPYRVTLPTPETYAKQQAALQTITQEPGVQAKLRETEATKNADLTRAIIQKQFDDQRNLETRRSNETIARAHDAARIAAAQIAASGKGQPTLDTDSIKPYVEGGIAGQYTLNELKKALPNKADFQAAMSGITAVGAVPFDDKQKQVIQQFEPAVNLLPQFQQIQDLINANPMEARTPFTKLHNDVQRRIAQVKEKLIDSITAFGQSGRLSDPRVKAITDAFAPSLKPNSDLANGTAANNFRQFLIDNVKGHLSNLSPGQVSTVVNRMGLTQSSTPGAAGAAPLKYTEADVRARAAAHGVDPDAAVQAAKQKGLLQ